MNIGIFSNCIAADSVERLAERIATYGLKHVVLDTFPGLDLDLDANRPAAADCRRIRRAFDHAGVNIAAVGGYSNLIHPHPEKNAAVRQRFVGLMKLCEAIGAPMLCSETGTYHPASDWDWDPANATDQAMERLLETVRPLADAAADYGVTLGFEPYVMNVCYTAERASYFIGQLDRDNVRLVADPAGLLTRSTLDRQHQALPDIFRYLSLSIGLVHAEDCLPDPAGHFQWLAAGRGRLDYGLFMSLVVQSGYEGPLILEHLAEEQIPGSKAYVLQKWQEAQTLRKGEKV